MNAARLLDPRDPAADLGTIEIVPGTRVIPLPVGVVDRWIVAAELQHMGGNNYRAIGRVRENYVRLTMDLPRRLGLGISYDGLKRLILAGFIGGGQFTPGAWSVSIDGIYRHQETVTRDRGFWTPARIRRYKEANFEPKPETTTPES